MPSVSNVAIGANLAAAAATKARHGMNESIARLSTGVRSMYGGDAAGQSMASAIAGDGKGYAQAARNIEDGISFAQMGESALLEVANLATRLRELGVQANNAALQDADQIAAITAEVNLLGDTIDAIVTNTKFNTKAVIDTATSTSLSVNTGTLTANTTSVGPATSMTAVAGTITTGITALDGSADADTVLQEVAEALGNIAADLTALKSFQAVAANTSANLAATSARLMDTDFALETADLTKNSILNQAALAMTSQANQAQSAVLAVLQ